MTKEHTTVKLILTCQKSTETLPQYTAVFSKTFDIYNEATEVFASLETILATIIGMLPR